MLLRIRQIYFVHVYKNRLRIFQGDSMNPRFEDGILDFMGGIPDFMDNTNILKWYMEKYTGRILS